MKLALRYALPLDAPITHRVSTAIIETRLVSNYSHGAIVIGNTLYQSNGALGVHSETDPDLSGYLLIDLGTDYDARALALFDLVNGSDYDFFSLLAFAIPGTTDSQRYYCYELCYLMMTGKNPRARVTPETLILVAMEMRDMLETPLVHLRSIDMVPQLGPEFQLAI